VEVTTMRDVLAQNEQLNTMEHELLSPEHAAEVAAWWRQGFEALEER